jgi:hypothetical protein
MIDRVQRRILRGGSIPCSLALVAVLLVALAATSSVAQGQPGDDVVLIVPALSPAPSSPQARGVFYRQTARVKLPGGTIELASSVDGQGALCTDDQATLIFAADGQEVGRWSHRFSTDDRRAIVCIPPQRQFQALAEGTYEITVELEDLYPDTYSSTAYYLIIGADDSDPPDAAETATPSPQPVIPSAAAGPAQIVAPTRGHPFPTATPAGVGIGRDPSPAIPSTPVPAASDTQRVEGGVPRWSPLGLALIAITLLLGVLALARIRRRRSTDHAPALDGVLYLFDRDTREAHTAMLPGDTRRIEVRWRPLKVVVPPAQEQHGVVVARVWSTAAGPMFHDLTDADGVPARLERDVPHTIADAIELRYRARHTFLGPQDTTRARTERLR